jgi:hypothetical protein
MKICPKCGSDKIIMFDSDNDYCEKCKKWFPAVGNEQCETGCKVFTGGEIRHHKDCCHYSNSLSEMLDDALLKIKELENKI